VSEAPALVPDRPSGPAAPAVTPGGEWHRLHPLSPLVRAGRGVLAIGAVLVITSLTGGNDSGDVYRLGTVAVFLVIGFVSWLVTRWRVEQGVLRIDRGLIRRSSERFPLTQVQAIDIVRPGLARLLGLAELRVRSAGAGGSSGRLAYLKSQQAEILRARLLALAHGVDESAPAPPERQLLSVPPGQLIISMLISGPGLLIEGLLCAVIVLAVLYPHAVGAIVAGGAASLLGAFGGLWQRLNGEYRMTVAEAPDGLRLRAGLVETSAETIPRARVQALRMIEPLTWRPFGWVRLEVDVAGKGAKGHQNGSARRASRSLLPVGSREQAAGLIERVMPGVPANRYPPPPRARWKAPLRYRHLSWGSNSDYAVASSGRLRKVTDWVPLAKVQSIRQVEGPVQRRLGLVDIHLDTAGHRIYAVLRDRARHEGAQLMATLPRDCRAARKRAV
jgi:putative membrane protein